MTLTVYVIKTRDGAYFAGRFNHFVEPVFEPRITGAKLFEEKAVAEAVLERLTKAVEDHELKSYFPDPRIYKAEMVLDKG